ncbi:MAG: hypothetical protein JST00_33950 [Deltaproteobacteria bacterium]|nr:hypothetical protein [Deltaproteobacteria bacterium]
MLSTAFFAVVVTCAPSAAAEEASQGFAVGRFEPAERGSDWFASDSLDIRGHLRPALGVSFDVTSKSLVHVDATGTPIAPIVGPMVLAHVGAALVVFERLRVGASMPLQLYADGTSATVAGQRYAAPANDQGLGDVRLAAHARLLGAYGDPATLATGARVWLPTGSQAQYLGDGSLRARPQLMLAGEVGHFAYAVETGVTFRHRDAPIGRAPLGPELGATIATGATFADRRVFVGPELTFSTVLEDAFSRATTPVEGSLGAHVLIARTVRVGASAGAGLTRGQGTPPVRVVVALEWLLPSFDDAPAGEGGGR